MGRTRLIELLKVAFPIGIRMIAQVMVCNRCYTWGIAKCNKNVGLEVNLCYLEALILASTNPQYDKRLFIDLPIK